MCVVVRACWGVCIEMIVLVCVRFLCVLVCALVCRYVCVGVGVLVCVRVLLCIIMFGVRFIFENSNPDSKLL